MQTDNINKLLSIIVASYNVENFLPKAINCYSQLLSNKDIENKLEILIINDGSTDKTMEIAMNFQLDFPNSVRVINKKNGGHGSCINTGIKEATGKYFFLVDADDWVNTEGLINLLKLLENNNNDIVCSKKREINMINNQSLLISLPNTIQTYKTFNLIDLQYNKQISAYLSLHTCCFRTSILKEKNISVLEHCFYVDNEFITKACIFCNTIIFYDLEVYQYLIGNPDQSVSNKKLAERYKQQEKVLDSLFLFYESNMNTKLIHFLEYKLSSLIKYYYKTLILLFDNTNDGIKLAKEYSKHLKRSNYIFWKSTRSRYIFLILLQAFHINGTQIFKIKSSIPDIYNKVFKLFR